MNGHNPDILTCLANTAHTWNASGKCEVDQIVEYKNIREMRCKN